MKNVFKALTKSLLIPLELTAAASPTDAAIQKKVFGSGICPLELAQQAALIGSNEEIDDIIKKLNLLKNLGYW